MCQPGNTADLVVLADHTLLTLSSPRNWHFARFRPKPRLATPAGDSRQPLFQSAVATMIHFFSDAPLARR